MSADEYQISMAGGDGDPDERLATIQKANEMWLKSPHTNRDDRNTAFLLALIGKRDATLTAVLELANARGRCGWSISSDEIRKALKA